MTDAENRSKLARSTRQEVMRVGIFGTFDVENYGDLLFPIIAERELQERVQDIEIVPYSYNKKDISSWCYDVRSLVSLANQPPEQHELDCILIGGGHLIRFDKTIAPGYTPPIPEIPHPTGYWLAPALAGITSGLPVIWNAPSASDAFPAWAEGLLAFVLNNSRYVALRDRTSVEALRKAGFEGTYSIVPDTAFALPQYFPRKNLRDRVKKVVAPLDLTEKYIVVQATPRVEAVAKALLSHRDFPSDVDVLALPIGPALGDDASHVQSFLPHAKGLPEWPSPDIIAGLIAHSAGVVAQSLHLSITALAYGLPVLRPAEATYGKYAPLHASNNVHLGSPQEPGTLTAFVGALRSSAPRVCAFAKGSQEQLREHWDCIAEICRQRRWSSSSPISISFGDANLLLTRWEKLGDEFHAQKARVDELEARLAERERQIEAVISGRDVARQALSSAHAEMTGLNEQISNLSHALSTKSDENSRITAHSEWLMNRLDALLNSNSWRITAPLRLASGAITPSLRRVLSSGGQMAKSLMRHPRNALHREQHLPAPAKSNSKSIRTKAYSLKDRGVADDRPRILILPAIFAVGGVERNTLAVMAQLFDQFRFVIVTNERHTAETGCLLDAAIEYAEAIFDLASLANRSEHLKLLREICAIMPPDLVWVCNGSVWYHQNVEAILNLFSSVPVVDQQVYDENMGWINSLTPEYAARVTKFVAINSRIERKFATALAPTDKVDLIYHAIDTDRLLPIQKRRVKQNHRYALIGRMVEQKRPLDFVEIARLVAPLNRPIEFFIVGGGPLRDKVSSKISKSGLTNISMRPFVDNVSEIYDSVDAVVFVSEYEGLPIVMLEALASGVPVLATDVGDIRKVADELGGGCVVVPDAIGHPARMAEALLEFDRDLGTHQDAALDIANIVRDRFGAKNVSRDYFLCWASAWQTFVDRDLKK